jgi:hypothetical protein
MQAVEPMHLLWLLAGVSVIAAMCTFVRAAVARRNKRRARGFFVLGFFCGLTAGVVLHRWRRGFNALAGVIRWVAVRRRRHGIRGGSDRIAARVLTVVASNLRLG